MLVADHFTITDNKLQFRPHPGQYRALKSTARFTLALAGTQGGKTVMGPIWLLNEMKARGVGDYLVVAPSFPLLDKKVLPETVTLFCRAFRLGDYKAGRKTLELYDGSTIYFGHASDPDSLESATAKAAWLDECGQDGFKLGSWEAIQRRLSIHQGRVLMTTTPYNLGWLKSEVYDRWQAGDPNYNVVRFQSIENPAFPRDEYERAKATLPRWKFDMFYNAIFTRPAGMIYDCVGDNHYVEAFTIPKDWHIYGGLDFGGVHTAAVRIAENPQNGALYVIDEYLQGGLTAKGHTANLNRWQALFFAGGAKSEGQWRDEFGAAGLPVAEPRIHEVEVGIDRVYGQFQNNRLYIFNHLRHLRDEIGTYSRKLDDRGQPTADIQNKNDYHLLDALRYIVGYLRGDEAWVLA